MRLKYIGNGKFIVDIPARDLTAEEVDKHGGSAFLIRTGLYKQQKIQKKKKPEVKDGRD